MLGASVRGPANNALSYGLFRDPKTYSDPGVEGSSLRVFSLGGPSYS